MTAVVAALDDGDAPRDAGGAAQAGRHDAGQHGRRGERPAVRHVLPAHGHGVGDGDASTRRAFAKALRAGLDGVVARGKAEAGDKTMYDALAPAVEALDAALPAGAARPTRWRRRRAAADAGRDATIPMLARKGRASYLGRAQRRPPGPGRHVGRAAGRRGRAPLPAETLRTSVPMVGIVVVSHSRALARAAVALAEEMLHGRPARIEVAAGLDDGTFGTDAVADPGRHRPRPTAATASSC